MSQAIILWDSLEWLSNHYLHLMLSKTQ